MACVTNLALARPFIRRASRSLWNAPNFTRQIQNRTFSQWRTASKSPIVNSLKSLSLGFTVCASSRKLTRDDIASVDLADIPKEVYYDDLAAKAKKRQSEIKLALYRLWSIFRTFLRSWRLALTFSPFVMTYPLTYVSSGFYRCWLGALLFVTERSGPTLVKFGQWASTRRDLFSREFCDLFGKLHRRAPPHTWAYTQQKLEKAFGRNWRDVLVRIDDKDKPLGSGCVAQVYKAYMPSEMVVDDDVLEEILEEIDDHTTPDYLDSFEILGFSTFLQRWTSGGGSRSEEEKQDERPALSFSKSKQRVPALSSRSEKAAREAALEEVKRRNEEEGRKNEEEMTDMEVAVQDGLVPVAVKVLHPGIYRAVQRDVQILRVVAWLCETLFPRLRWLSVRDCVDEFAEIMEKQIDLRHEASCLEKFYDNFEHIPHVRFPRPVRPFVKRNVLVETFEEGEPIGAFLEGRAGDVSAADSSVKPGGGAGGDVADGDRPGLTLNEKLADIGADALLQMIFIDNFIHGDLHPGNIFVQNAQDYNTQDDSKLTLVDICDTTVVNVRPVDCSLRLVLLDVGITSSLSQVDKRAFHRVMKAVVLGQGEKVGSLLLDNARKHECRDRAGFVREIAAIVREARERTIRLGKMQVGDLLSNVFSVLSRHRVKLESNFLSVILAIMVLEGLGRSLDPDMDILHKAKPVLLNATIG